MRDRGRKIEVGKIKHKLYILEGLKTKPEIRGEADIHTSNNIPSLVPNLNHSNSVHNI